MTDAISDKSVPRLKGDHIKAQQLEAFSKMSSSTRELLVELQESERALGDESTWFTRLLLESASVLRSARVTMSNINRITSCAARDRVAANKATAKALTKSPRGAKGNPWWTQEREDALWKLVLKQEDDDRGRSQVSIAAEFYEMFELQLNEFQPDTLAKKKKRAEDKSRLQETPNMKPIENKHRKICERAILRKIKLLSKRRISQMSAGKDVTLNDISDEPFYDHYH